MTDGMQTADRLRLEVYDELHRNSAWYIGLGVVLFILGAIATAFVFATTFTTVVFFGWFLVAGGVLEAAHAFWRQTWGGFFINLLTGILYLVVGAMIVASPAATAAALTLIISLFLMVGGVFRIIAAFVARYPNWGWLALHGVVSLALGILIWQGWPASALWVIGLFIGIELMANGVALTLLGMGAKRLPMMPA